MAVDGYTILLMNTGKDGEESAATKLRNDAFKRVVKDTKPSIIFLQEATGSFGKVIKGSGYSFSSRESSDKAYTRPSMLFNMNTFTCKYLSKEQGEKVVDKLTSTPNSKLSDNFNLFDLDRLSVATFTSKPDAGPELVVLGISWHGPRRKLKGGKDKIDDVVRQNILKDFCVVVKEIRSSFPGTAGKLLPVIVGGDFNLKISPWPKDYDLIPVVYTPSERRKDKQIDFFAATEDLHLSYVKYRDLSFELEDGITKASDLLKHDPVVAVLSVRISPDTSSSEVADADQMFKKLAIKK